MHYKSNAHPLWTHGYPLPTIVWSANYVDNGAADSCKQETVDKQTQRQSD